MDTVTFSYVSVSSNTRDVVNISTNTDLDNIVKKFRVFLQTLGHTPYEIEQVLTKNQTTLTSYVGNGNNSGALTPMYGLTTANLAPLSISQISPLVITGNNSITGFQTPFQIDIEVVNDDTTGITIDNRAGSITLLNL